MSISDHVIVNFYLYRFRSKSHFLFIRPNTFFPLITIKVPHFILKESNLNLFLNPHLLYKAIRYHQTYHHLAFAYLRYLFNSTVWNSIRNTFIHKYSLWLARFCNVQHGLFDWNGSVIIIQYTCSKMHHSLQSQKISEKKSIICFLYF